MRNIRATCLGHGDSEISSETMAVLRFSYPDGGELYGYRFFCQVAGHTEMRLSAQQRVVDLLIASGVRIDTITLPEPEGQGALPFALTESEIDDFVIDLQSWPGPTGPESTR